MSKKSDSFYFNNFEECIEVSCQAAALLKSTLEHFNEINLEEKLEEMHRIENEGDSKKHQMMNEIVKAFITPLEKEDILCLSQNIDRITDAIEDILIQIYTNNVKEIPREAIAFAELINSCCLATKELVHEFRNFRKSKTLHDLIVKINHIEEQGDKMYMCDMRKLHSKEQDLLTVISWRAIYEFFEKSCDACESVADLIETIAVGNS